MSTDNIDDLFRRQLGDHATPPGNDLWARLQAGPDTSSPASEHTAAAPERVDQLYQQRLTAHLTPAPREIWERLEDEHLRPRKRRTAAWWPMALAAAVALLLLAGGAGLWLGFPGGSVGPAGTVALQSGGQRRVPASNHSTAANKSVAVPNDNNGQVQTPSVAQTDLAATTKAADSAAGQSVAQASETTISSFNQKNIKLRATRPESPASSASKVGMMAQQSPRRQREASRQPDAVAANSASLMASTKAQPATPTHPADVPAPAFATVTLPASKTNPAEEIVPATSLSLATPPPATLITVDVHNGAARRPSLATAVATAAAATEERPGLGGRLLRQVGHAVRGERISLSEVTGLPENLTLEANIAGRRVSKSIQL